MIQNRTPIRDDLLEYFIAYARKHLPFRHPIILYQIQKGRSKATSGVSGKACIHPVSIHLSSVHLFLMTDKPDRCKKWGDLRWCCFLAKDILYTLCHELQHIKDAHHPDFRFLYPTDKQRKKMSRSEWEQTKYTRERRADDMAFITTELAMREPALRGKLLSLAHEIKRTLL